MDCSLYIDGVPECDCGRDEGQAAYSATLLREAAVSDLSKTSEETARIEGTSFAFVETGVNAAAKLNAVSPREDEERPFDPAQFTWGNSDSFWRG